MKKIIIALLILAIFSLLFVNCEKEEIAIPTSNDQISTNYLADKNFADAKMWFKENRELNSFKILDYSDALDWNLATINYDEDKYAIEIPIEFSKSVAFKNSLTSFRLLIVFNSNEYQYRSYIANIVSANNTTFNNNLSKVNYFNIPKFFDGYTSLIDSNNKFVEQTEYLKGEIVIDENTRSKTLKGSKQYDYTCHWIGWLYADGTFEPIELLYCTGYVIGENTSSGQFGLVEEVLHGNSNSSDNDANNGCRDGYVIGPDGCVPKEKERILVETESTPKIDDVKKELKCFDKSNKAKLTIYVEQAVENSREVTARLGHTFIGIEQNGVIRNLGFYPDNGGAANLISNQDSEIHDNSGSPYHVSITVEISASQLSSIITYTEDYPEKYDLNNYNCSDFGIAVAALGGLSLPATVGSYGIFFKGRNPGDLGEDMRELTLPSGATRDLIGGTAPNRSADCP